MEEEKRKYRYSGAVTDQFGSIISDDWTGTTYAVSEKKALANLRFRFLNENGFDPRMKKVRLTGHCECVS